MGLGQLGRWRTGEGHTRAGCIGLVSVRHRAQGRHQPRGDKRVQQKIRCKARVIEASPLNQRASINIDATAAPWRQQLAGRCLEAQRFAAVRWTVQRGIEVCGHRRHSAQCDHKSQVRYTAAHSIARLQATHPPTDWSVGPAQKSPAPSAHAWRGPCFPCAPTGRSHPGLGRAGPGRCWQPACPAGCRCR